ncbi:MAG: hypothetical protein ACOX4Q_05920 [Syntrophomonadales bacterium]
MAGSCIAVTEERKQSVLFSDPVYTGGSVLTVVANSAVGPGGEQLFVQHQGTVSPETLSPNRATSFWPRVWG